MKNGTRLQSDLDEPLESEIVTGLEVSGECVKGIRVEVGAGGMEADIGVCCGGALTH